MKRSKIKWCKVWVAAQLRLQKGRCHWCGRVMNTTDCESPMYRTVEHLKPWSKGGSDGPDNCMLACLECNRKRGNGDQQKVRIRRVRIAPPPTPKEPSPSGMRGWWLKAYNRQKKLERATVTVNERT